MQSTVAVGAGLLGSAAFVVAGPLMVTVPAPMVALGGVLAIAFFGMTLVVCATALVRRIGIALVPAAVARAGARRRADGPSPARPRQRPAAVVSRSSTRSGARSETRRKSPSVVPVAPLSTLRGPRPARTSSMLMVRRS